MEEIKVFEPEAHGIRLPCASEVTWHMRLSINVIQNKTGFVRPAFLHPLLCSAALMLTYIALALMAVGCADWTAALQPYTQQTDSLHSDTIEFLSCPSSINLIMDNTVIHVW